MAYRRTRVPPILKLVLLVLVVYIAYSELWPRLHTWASGLSDRFSPAGLGDSAGDDAGSLCVEAALRANRAFGERAAKLTRPPYDRTGWGIFKAEVDRRIGDAERACICEQSSCDRAAEAVGQLRSLLEDFDSAVQGGEPPASPATDMARIDDLLDQARQLAGRGR